MSNEAVTVTSLSGIVKFAVAVWAMTTPPETMFQPVK